MRYFLQLLLFTDSLILPGGIDFCAVYFSVSYWNRSFTQQILVTVVPRTSKISKSTSLFTGLAQGILFSRISSVELHQQ